jgi:uncharacterized protein (DUF2461 family)
VRVSGGFYEAGTARLGAIREAIADERTGRRLQRVVATLEKDGWAISGDQLRTAPRGYAADHPRIDLLRRKQLFASHSYGFDDVIHTPALLDRVRADWQTLRPLVDWVVRNAAAT